MLTSPEIVAKPPASGPLSAGLWRRVDELVDRAPNDWALRTHKLTSFAVRRRRAAGQAVPKWMAMDERAAALIALGTPTVLARIREAAERDIVVLKGPGVAARYPNGGRTYNDLDVLVRDGEAQRLHAALLESGFMAVEDPDLEELAIDYHLQPLAWERLPLRIEIHTRPNWPPDLPGVPVDELFAGAVAEAAFPDGVLVPAPAHHALLLAGHGWTERTFGCLRDLIDVAVMAEGIPASELQARADAWGMGRLWAATWRAVEAVLFRSRPTPLSLRVWAGHLEDVRERTVLENHLERLLSPFSALPPGKAARRSMNALAAEVRPLENETWGAKGRRAGQALRRAFQPRSEHEFQLGELAPPRRYGRFGIGFWRDADDR